VEHDVFLKLCRLIDNTQLNHIILTKSFYIYQYILHTKFLLYVYLFTYIPPADLGL